MDYQFIIVFAFINYTCNYVSVHVAILVCAHTHMQRIESHINCIKIARHALLPGMNFGIQGLPRSPICGEEGGGKGRGWKLHRSGNFFTVYALLF